MAEIFSHNCNFFSTEKKKIFFPEGLSSLPDKSFHPSSTKIDSRGTLSGMFCFILLSEADGKTDEMIDEERVSEYTHVMSVL